MTDVSVQTEKLEFRRVVQGTFGVLGRNFVTFLGLTLILVGIPMVILGLIQMEALSSDSLTSWVWFLVTGLIAMTTAFVLQGALVFGAINDLNGRRVSLAESLTVGMRNILPLFAVSLLYSLAIGFGSLLLIVPGIMIAIAWCVAVPVLIAERRDVFATFGRSAQLTRGSRWRIFALLLIYFVIYFAIALLISAIAGAVGAGFDITDGSQLTPVHLAFNVASSVLSNLIGATGIAVLYTELRRVKEGATPDALAAVFD